MTHACRIVGVTLALILAGWTGLWAAAPSARVEAGGSTPTARGLLADQLTVMMHQALDGRGELQSHQLRRARVLLDAALSLRPDDPERWRLRAELASRLDEQDANLHPHTHRHTHRDALTHYIRLRPDDDAAQLALFRARLQDIQTVDGRLDRLERILRSPQARRFSDPLRSRLALDAAHAADELGQIRRVVHWLGQAVSLDPANPEAAAFAYELALGRSRTMVELGTAAIRRVAAAPADPDARLALAEVLLSQALYRLAAHQYAAAADVSIEPLPTGTGAPLNWALALAAAGDDERALARLDGLEATPEVGLLRLTILTGATGQRHEDAVDEAYAELHRVLAAMERDDQPGAARAAADLAWVQVLVGRDIDEAATLTDTLAERLERGDVGPLDVEGLRRRLARLRAWLELRRGDRDAAEAALREQVDDDPFARLGLAELAEADEQRRRYLVQTVHRSPGSLAGLLAARGLRAMGEDAVVEPTASGYRLAALMDRYPVSLWRPTLDAAPWTAVEVRVPRAPVGYLEPVTATLTLRNASRMALPLADGHGAPTRVVVMASAHVDGERVDDALPPVVVDMARRLVLEPGERVTVDVRLDHGPLGAMLARSPHADVRLDVRAVLDPLASRDGEIVAGPLGAVSSGHRVAIPGLPNGPAVTDAIDALQADDAGAQMRAAAYLARMLMRLADLESRQRVGGALAAWAGEGDTLRLAWLARFAPDNEAARDVLGDALDRIAQSDEPLVRIVYLASRVDDADDAMLEASREHADDDVRAFAAALGQALRD